jgi:hypothetical protein
VEKVFEGPVLGLLQIPPSRIDLVVLLHARAS